MATVYVPVLSHFEWSLWRATQTEGSPISLSITARDAHGYRVPSFSGSVQLSGMIPRATLADVSIGEESGTWNFPMRTGYHDARTQVIYLASEIGGARLIDSLSLDVVTVPGQTLHNWTLRIKHTPRSSYASPEQWESGWATVHQGDVNVTSTGWNRFEFDALFEYNGTDNLMVGFSHNSSTYTSNGYCKFSEVSAYRSLSYETDSGYGNPLDWAGASNPTPNSTEIIPNIRMETCVAEPVSISLAATGLFVNGVWTGTVTVLAAASNMVLQADDGSGHRGQSRLFNALADTDADGIPDAWETRHFGDPTNAVAAATAANGVNTVYECYVADLDPFASSLFAITSFHNGVVGFHSSSNRLYSLVLRTNLAGGAWMAIDGPRAGVGGVDTMSGSADPASGYYRLEVELP